MQFHNVNQSSWSSTLANPGNGTDYSSHLLSATLPLSLQHFLKYSESIKKEIPNGNGNVNMNVTNSLLNSGNDLLGLKNGSNLLGNVASLAAASVNQHHLNHHHSQHHNFMNGNDNNLDHHVSSGLNIPNHNSIMNSSLLNHNQNGNGISSSNHHKSNNNSHISGNGTVKVKKERKKSIKQPNAVKKPKKKKPPKERKQRPKVSSLNVNIRNSINHSYLPFYSLVKFVRKQHSMEHCCIVVQNVKWLYQNAI